MRKTNFSGIPGAVTHAGIIAAGTLCILAGVIGITPAAHSSAASLPATVKIKLYPCDGTDKEYSATLSKQVIEETNTYTRYEYKPEKISAIDTSEMAVQRGENGEQRLADPTPELNTSSLRDVDNVSADKNGVYVKVYNDTSSLEEKNAYTGRITAALKKVTAKVNWYDTYRIRFDYNGGEKKAGSPDYLYALNTGTKYAQNLLTDPVGTVVLGNQLVDATSHFAKDDNDNFYVNYFGGAKFSYSEIKWGNNSKTADSMGTTPVKAGYTFYGFSDSPKGCGENGCNAYPCNTRPEFQKGLDPLFAPWTLHYAQEIYDWSYLYDDDTHEIKLYAYYVPNASEITYHVNGETVTEDGYYEGDIFEGTDNFLTKASAVKKEQTEYAYPSLSAEDRVLAKVPADHSILGWSLIPNGTKEDIVVKYKEAQTKENLNKIFDLSGYDTIDSLSPVKADLYAVYGYKISFDGNGANGSMEDIEVEDDTTAELPENTFYKNNSAFLGWALSKEDADNRKVTFTNKAAVNNIGGVSGKVTLYAVWDTERNEYDRETSQMTKTATRPAVGTVFTSGNYAYEIKSLNNVTLVGTTKEDIKTVNIKNTVEYSGYKYYITKIADGAFQNFSTIKTVKIGNRIRRIGSKAFYKNTALKNLTIGRRVKKVGKKAFAGCSSLKKKNVKNKSTLSTKKILKK